VARLDAQDQSVEQLKAALDIQFRRIAAMQSELDLLRGTRAKPRG